LDSNLELDALTHWEPVQGAENWSDGFTSAYTHDVRTFLTGKLQYSFDGIFPYNVNII
jgi:hypothetical protein